MTEMEMSLIEAALNWRRNHGPCHPHEPGDLREIGVWAEGVIRERNRTNQSDEPPKTVARGTTRC